MDNQSRESGTRAGSRIHWTARVSCGLSVYIALDFLLTWGLLFSHLASSVSRWQVPFQLSTFFTLLNRLITLVLFPFHPWLPQPMQMFLPLILSYLIPFVLACLALGISSKQAWRKGQRLAMGSTILSGIVLVLGGGLSAFLLFV